MCSNSLHDGEDRRGSEMTLACTVDSNYYYEPDSSMVEYYGIEEIKHAKRIQEQRQREQSLNSNFSRFLSNERETEDEVGESSAAAQTDSIDRLPLAST